MRRIGALFIVLVCFAVAASADLPIAMESVKGISFDSITNSQQSNKFEFPGFQGRPGIAYRNDMSSCTETTGETIRRVSSAQWNRIRISTSSMS